MNYYTFSFRLAFENQLEKNTKVAEERRIFTMQSLPAKNMLNIAHSLKEYVEQKHPEYVLSIKMAQPMVLKWTEEEQGDAIRSGFFDEGDSLTAFRNQISENKKTILLLCGIDKITDKGSLIDFQCLSTDYIFENIMGRSFSLWAAYCLEQAHIDASKQQIEYIDGLLRPLYDMPNGTLITISDWLDSLNLNICETIAEIKEVILSHTDVFALPSFKSFANNPKLKSLSKYVKTAENIFIFNNLSQNTKNKYIKAIEIAREKVEDGTFDNISSASFGKYTGINDLLDGLDNYFTTGDYKEKEKLLSCDFVVVADKIFSIREKKNPPVRSAIKIEGEPVVVLLTAVWKTLRALHTKNKSVFDETEIASIRIVGLNYKHPEDTGSGDGSAQGSDLAREGLTQLIGGVDNLLNSQLAKGNWEGDFNNVDFSCDIFNEGLNTETVKNCIAELKFKVTVQTTDDYTEKLDFVWKIKSTDDYVLSNALIAHCYESIPDVGPYLPVYFLNYYEELLSTTSDDDTREILQHSLSEIYNKSFSQNMLESQDAVVKEDPLYQSFIDLGKIYSEFIERSYQYGIIDALFVDNGRYWHALQKRYNEICQESGESFLDGDSNIAPMLMRAFLVVQQRASTQYSFYEKTEKSALITVLHPALLEMLESQLVYILACFRAACAQSAAGKEKHCFGDAVWNNFCDMARIQTPLECLMCDDGQITVDTRGSGLFHKIGTAHKYGDTVLSTRLSMDSDGENDQVADSKLFVRSNESQILLHILKNYTQTHAQAWDGIRLSFFRSYDIQPVIAAIHDYLEWVADLSNGAESEFAQRMDPYNLAISFYTDKKDDGDIEGYIARWDDAWQEMCTRVESTPYRWTRKSISHKILSDGSARINSNRLNNIDFDADIAFFCDISMYGKTNCIFEDISGIAFSNQTLKFPLLEKKTCSLKRDKFERRRLISHRQFSTSARFTSMVAYLGDKEYSDAAILSTTDFREWIDLLDTVHTRSEWVVCIDPNVDRNLLKEAALATSSEKREIISFGSGVGSHGESNYTISTQQSGFSALRECIAKSIGNLYSERHWEFEALKKIANNLIDISSNLNGLSLIRAASQYDRHVHDFVAYTLSKKFLKPEEGVLASIFVSLDDYPHWFKFNPKRTHPDLLWLTVSCLDNKTFSLQARLIECKLGHANAKFIEKARDQILAGYTTLKDFFTPHTESGVLDDTHPDRRYWWMQLHRIISSSLIVSKPKENREKTIYLENLAEGNFSIDWGACILAYWVDSNADTPESVCRWNLDEEQTPNLLFVLGSGCAYKLAMENEPTISMTWAEMDAANGNVDVALPDYPEEDPNDLDAQDSDNDMWDLEYDDDDMDVDELDSTGSDAGSLTIRNVTDFAPKQISLIDDANTDVAAESIDGEGAEDIEDIVNSNGKQALPLCVEGENGSEGNAEAYIPATVSEPVDLVQDAVVNLSDIRIYLGKDRKGKEMFWEFGNPKLNNRHLLIFGSSGSGKTYAMQCILCELARAGAHNLILDYTGSFIPTEIKKGAEAFFPEETQHFIRLKPLALNPFQPQEDILAGQVILEDPIDLAGRVVSIFDRVYGLGIQQSAVLAKQIEDGVASLGTAFTFDELNNRLQEQIEEGGSSAKTIETLTNRIRKILLKAPFTNAGDIGWEKIFSSALKNKIFQFQSIDPETTQAVVGFLLWDLYSFVQRNGSEAQPKIVVLDEVQNLDLSPNAPTSKYLVEGRKFGLALIAATQTIKGIGGSSAYSTTTLFQAAQKLFFQPSPTELADFAKVLHDLDGSLSVQEWKNQLSSLNKGECYFVGSEAVGDTLRQVVRKIKITALEDRNF